MQHGPYLYRQLGFGAVAIADQMLCARLKIVKHVLLLQNGPSLPPLDAVFTSAPASQLADRLHQKRHPDPNLPTIQASTSTEMADDL